VRARLVIALALVLAACEQQAPRQPDPDPTPSAGFFERLEQTYRNYSSEAPASIIVPVRGVTRSRIADTFGAARSGNRKHEGVDIFAPEGTPVLAAAPGLVTQVGSNNLGGLVVTVWGEGNRRYYYAHLSAYAPYLREGDVVQAGDVIGLVGRTGNARGTPPHLHFGVYQNGWQAIDPLPLLADD
jgi:murein DD-endopeptidase MepM/ murein hydrolase activator NlpD